MPPKPISKITAAQRKPAGKAPPAAAGGAAPARRASPSLEVIYRPAASLVPYAKNSKKHPPAQIAALKGSIQEFGFVSAVLLDSKGGIIAGHARVQAAMELGMVDVPTITLGHLTDLQRRAYVIADNRLAELAIWDADMLRVEMEGILAEGMDMEVLGWDERSLREAMGPTPAEVDERANEAPPVPEVITSRLGDLWVMGPHRLLCGDATEFLDAGRVLGKVIPNLMVTDPPYGVNYDPDWRNKALRSDGTKVGGRAVGQVMNDDRADWREAWKLFPGNVAYVWHAGMFGDIVADSLKASKFNIRAQIVWVKTRHVLSRGHYHPQHEPALYAVKEAADDGWRFEEEHEDALYAVKMGRTADWNGGRKQSTVWFIEHLKSETGHGTQKPIEAMRRPILNNSSAGQAVYEPFSGSGTTLIACQMTGRSFIGLELDPAYVDVAVTRWQNWTGAVAILDGDGRTFEEVAAARAAEGGGPRQDPSAAPLFPPGEEPPE